MAAGIPRVVRGGEGVTLPAERQAEIDATHEAALAALEEGQEPPAKPPDAVPDPEPFVFTQTGTRLIGGAHDLEPLGSETIGLVPRRRAGVAIGVIRSSSPCFDVEEAMGAHQEVEVKITAEAHVEALRVEYPRSTEDAVPQDEPEPETAEEAAKRRPGALDFGLVKATEPSAREFTLANDGAHAVKFAFRVLTGGDARPVRARTRGGGGGARRRGDGDDDVQPRAPGGGGAGGSGSGGGDGRRRAGAGEASCAPAPREVTLKNNEDIILDVFDAEDVGADGEEDHQGVGSRGVRQVRADAHPRRRLRPARSRGRERTRARVRAP